MSDQDPRPETGAADPEETPATRQQPAVRPGSPPTSRFFRGAGIVLAVLCVIVAGIAVRFTDELEFEVVSTVDLGETTGLNGGRVTVTGVEVGQILDVGTIEPEHVETGGVFLIATVRLEAPREEEKIGGLSGLQLYTEEHTYASFGGSSVITVPAGYVGTTRVMFEVDPDHLAGAELELARDETVWFVPQKVRVRLGVSERNADDWARSAEGRMVDGSQSVELEALG